LASSSSLRLTVAKAVALEAARDALGLVAREIARPTKTCASLASEMR
jgi:hypothetical protein